MMAGPPSLWNAKLESSSPQSRQGLAEYLQCDAIRWEQFLRRCRLIIILLNYYIFIFGLKCCLQYRVYAMLTLSKTTSLRKLFPSDCIHTVYITYIVLNLSVPELFFLLLNVPKGIPKNIIKLYICIFIIRLKIDVIQSIKLELMGVGDEL